MRFLCRRHVFAAMSVATVVWSATATASMEWAPIAARVEESDVIVVGELVDVQMNRYATRRYEDGGAVDDTRAGDYTQQWWHSGFIEVREWLKGESWLGQRSEGEEGSERVRVEVVFFGQEQDSRTGPGTGRLNMNSLVPREGMEGVWLLDHAGPDPRTCRPHMELWPLPADSVAYVRRCLEVEVVGCAALPAGLPRAGGSWLVSCGSESRESVSSMGTTADGGMMVVGLRRSDVMVEGRRALAVDTPGMFVAEFTGEGAVRRVSPLGVFRGALHATSLGSEAMVVDEKGFVTVAGVFFRSIEFDGEVLKSGRDQAGFLVRSAPDGTVVWARPIGGAISQWPALALGPDGNVVVAATFRGQMGYGPRYLTARGHTDVALFAVDAAGNPVWMTQVGDKRTEHCSGVLATPDGGYVLFGQSVDNAGAPRSWHNYVDAWIVSLGPNGEMRWEHRMGKRCNDYVYSAVVARDGGVVACLVLTDESSDLDIYGRPRPGAEHNVTRRWDADGNLVWECAGGGESLDVDGRGRILVAGSYGEGWRTIDFPEPAGEKDLFIEVLSPRGERLGLWRDGGMSTERVVAARWADDGSVLFLGTYRASSYVAGTTLRPYGDDGFFVGRVRLPLQTSQD